MLTIAEELILLGTDDDKGTTVADTGSKLNYGLVGAILAELTIQEKIKLEEDKVVVIDDSPTGISYFNSVISEINDEKRPREVKYWIEKLSGRKDEINEPIYLSLVQKGILREEAKTYFLVFNQAVYPTIDEEPEENIRQKVNRVIFDNESVDTRTAMLLSLIYTCHLVTDVFGKENSKKAEKRINEMMDKNEYGDAVKSSIENMEAAILAATTMFITTNVIIPNSNN